ncbi:MAG: hypothetical protein IPJ31_00345 [Bacteroidetes bacterium]|nr:hypothetical protein [Bacteroidota bacterium]
MEKLLYQRFIIVKDSFYENIDEVLQAAKSATYYEPEHVTGFRSTTVYHQKNIRRKLEQILGIPINRWDTDPIQENGVFYQGFSKGKRREIPGVHSDEPYNDITILIYLTPDLPVDCGTSLWMHKETGLMNPATPQDARKLGMTLSALRELLEVESTDRSKWVEIDRIGNRLNRMVAYPSGVFHSATKHFGSTMSNGRLYQTFRVGVDWNRFSMNQK